MPNEQNICSPVSLISPARSGTSLLHRVIAAHPQFAGAGETASVIFGPWYAVERPRGHMRPTEEDGRRLSLEEKATRVVHNTFLTLFHDEKSRWVHKLIGEPEVWRLIVARQRGMDAALEWYWSVMNQVFPEGSVITILRNPFDMVLTQLENLGLRRGGPPDGSEERIWRSIATMASVLTHRNSSNSHAIIYADFVSDPEGALTRLFTEIDVPFHPRVMNPLEANTAPGEARIDPETISRSDDWHKLNPEFVTPEIERPIVELWSKFGARFEVPGHFAARGVRFLDANGAE